MEAFSVEETTTISGAKIIVVGVGGGGGNMIGHMISEGIDGIEMIVANTDAQMLDHSQTCTKIQLGAKLTKGLGAGMKPDAGPVFNRLFVALQIMEGDIQHVA